MDSSTCGGVNRAPIIPENRLYEQAVGRLQAKALSALRQLKQVQHQARFELEKVRLDHGKKLEAAKAAGRHEVRKCRLLAVDANTVLPLPAV